MPSYVFAQLLAATLASGTLRLMFGGRLEHFPGTTPTGSAVQSLVIEFITSFYLMFVISSVATDNRAVMNHIIMLMNSSTTSRSKMIFVISCVQIGELAGLAVGATILLNVFISGYGMLIN